MKRLFTYGCSFTSYQYPTWADYIGCLFDENYTFALSGAGNKYSFTQLKNSLSLFNITKEDTIIFQVTGTTRQDILNSDFEWIGGGHIYSNPNYSKRYIQDCFDILNSLFDLYTNLNFLSYLKEHLEYNIIIVPMLSFKFTQNLGEIGYSYDFDDSEYSDAILKMVNSLQEYEKKYMIDTDIFSFQLDQSEKKHIWYDPSSDVFVENDDHPSTKTHYRFVLDVLSKYIDDIDLKPLLSPKMVNLVETWESFFNGEIDIRQNDEYINQICKFKMSESTLGVGWPHFLTKTQYNHITLPLDEI